MEAIKTATKSVTEQIYLQTRKTIVRRTFVSWFRNFRNIPPLQRIGLTRTIASLTVRTNLELIELGFTSRDAPDFYDEKHLHIVVLNQLDTGNITWNRFVFNDKGSSNTVYGLYQVLLALQSDNFQARNLGFEFVSNLNKAKTDYESHALPGSLTYHYHKWVTKDGNKKLLHLKLPLQELSVQP